MRGVLKSLAVSVWFMVLTFPILVIKVAPTTNTIIYRFENALYLGVGIFFLSFIWRALMVRKGITTPQEEDLVWLFELLKSERNQNILKALTSIFIASVPSFVILISGSKPSVLSASAFALGLVIAGIFLKGKAPEAQAKITAISDQFQDKGPIRTISIVVGILFFSSLAFYLDTYRINVLISTFIWVMLGLGLSVMVGQAGMLVLGYAAFYALGGYTYALGNQFFDSAVYSFWVLLPLGGFVAALAGILLSLPVLRLRGDYLAIVTLGFGEIVRVILEGGRLSLSPLADLISWITGLDMPGWMYATLEMGGPAGIAGIPAPQVPGMTLTLDQGTRFLYFIAMAMACLTIFAVGRLRDSRLGRSWQALREDEIACESMGINKVSAKLSAFALGACWAGFGGVLFAAKNSFINPTSFTFMESALILAVVVLGGQASILGVIFGAGVLILLPEYLRSFDQYRMLIFGASMALMMVFRPQGLITPRSRHKIKEKSKIPDATSSKGGA